jgi:hypothetical protein
VPFTCSICEQESTRICAFCTKDACAMHICERCGCCSDCCECEVPLEEPVHEPVHAHAAAPPESPPAEHPADARELAPPLAGSDLELEPPAEPWAPAEAQSATPEESAPEPPEV